MPTMHRRLKLTCYLEDIKKSVRHERKHKSELEKLRNKVVELEKEPA